MNKRPFFSTKKSPLHMTFIIANYLTIFCPQWSKKEIIFYKSVYLLIAGWMDGWMIGR